MLEKLKKLEPIYQILMVAMIIIIIIAVFSPRGSSRLSAGLNVDGHVGGFRGGFNVEAFENGTSPSLVMFYAPWCGHCKKAMPEFDKLSNIHQGNVTIGKVNCDEQTDLAKTHNIQGYPTIKYFPSGMSNPSSVHDYDGERTASAMNNFLNKITGTQGKLPDNAAPY